MAGQTWPPTHMGVGGELQAGMSEIRWKSWVYGLTARYTISMKNTNTSKENAVQLKPRKVAVRPKFTVTGLEPDEKTAKQWEKGAFDRMAIIETLRAAGKPMDAYEIDEALKLDGRLVSQSGYL